jgi:hypothetical protein
VKSDEIVIEYMSETTSLIVNMLWDNYKLLWDGSLSPTNDP